MRSGPVTSGRPVAGDHRGARSRPHRLLRRCPARRPRRLAQHLALRLLRGPPRHLLWRLSRRLFRRPPREAAAVKAGRWRTGREPGPGDSRLSSRGQSADGAALSLLAQLFRVRHRGVSRAWRPSRRLAGDAPAVSLSSLVGRWRRPGAGRLRGFRLFLRLFRIRPLARRPRRERFP